MSNHDLKTDKFNAKGNQAFEQATGGNFSFGLNDVYGFGSDDRSNTQINVNVRYRF